MPENNNIQPGEFDVLDEEIRMQKKIAKTILDSKKPLEILFKWNAPERFFEKKDTRWFVIVAAVALVTIVLSALTNNFILIFAVISLVIVIYAVYTIPPREVEHQITNKGIYTLNTLHLWNSISYFWVSRRGGQYLLNVEYRKKNNDTYYQRMILIMKEKDYKNIVEIISNNVAYLGPESISKDALTSFAEGKYIPILDILNPEVQETKK